MGISFGLNMFGQVPTISGASASDTSSLTSTDADLKEYKSLLDKKSKGMLNSREQSRFNELQDSLSKSGKLNRDGSVKTRTNSDKLKANARKMSWQDAPSVWGANNGLISSRAASIVQKTASHALTQQNRFSSGMMSKNGSIFGRG